MGAIEPARGTATGAASVVHDPHKAAKAKIAAALKACDIQPDTPPTDIKAKLETLVAALGDAQLIDEDKDIAATVGAALDAAIQATKDFRYDLIKAGELLRIQDIVDMAGLDKLPAVKGVDRRKKDAFLQQRNALIKEANWNVNVFWDLSLVEKEICLVELYAHDSVEDEVKTFFGHVLRSN